MLPNAQFVFIYLFILGSGAFGGIYAEKMSVQLSVAACQLQQPFRVR